MSRVSMTTADTSVLCKIIAADFRPTRAYYAGPEIACVAISATLQRYIHAVLSCSLAYYADNLRSFLLVIFC